MLALTECIALIPPHAGGLVLLAHLAALLAELLLGTDPLAWLTDLPAPGKSACGINDHQEGSSVRGTRLHEVSSIENADVLEPDLPQLPSQRRTLLEAVAATALAELLATKAALSLTELLLTVGLTTKALGSRSKLRLTAKALAGLEAALGMSHARAAQQQSGREGHK